MKRPILVHFMGIETSDRISIRASLTLSRKPTLGITEKMEKIVEEVSPSSPWQSLGLLSSTLFKLKVVALNSELGEIFHRIYESDSYGNFDFKIPIHDPSFSISRLQVFEVGMYQGLELLLGNFIPIKIKDPKKIIISDFDKTLVDTRYSTTKEVYYSLTKPLNHFPRIDKSIELYKKHIAEDFQPFILTASPHFYEEAIRDWLYQNEIYTAGIFLKDYRKIFSLIESDMTTKDLKTQGFYKLNQLINILLMTGIPEELILMGDGFESDTIIYLTLVSLLNDKIDPWSLWNVVKGQESFRLTNQQNSRFLNKIYQLKTQLVRRTSLSTITKIFIRCLPGRERPKIHINTLRKNFSLVEFYEA